MSIDKTMNERTPTTEQLATIGEQTLLIQRLSQKLDQTVGALVALIRGQVTLDQFSIEKDGSIRFTAATDAAQATAEPPASGKPPRSPRPTPKTRRRTKR